MFESITNLLKHIKQASDNDKSFVAANDLIKETAAIIEESKGNENACDLEIPRATNQSLLDAFNKKSDDDKILLLHSAILMHRKDITIQNHRHRLAKDLVLFNLRAWLVKVFVIACLVFVGLLLLLFGYILIKNSAFSDTSLFSSFFKSVEEVFKLLFFIIK